MTMISQTQFLAILGRVGGPGAQPESATALSEGLGWANFHLLALPASNASNVTNATDDSATGRRSALSGRRKAVKKSISMSGADVTEIGTGCDYHANSPREIGGTVLTCLMAIFGCFLARVAVNKLIQWLAARKARKAVPPRELSDEEKQPTIPFGAWELQVFGIMFLGLSESAGEAIASECPKYEIAGGIVLFVLLLSWLSFLVMVYLALRLRCMEWRHVPLRQGINEMKKVLKESKGKPLLTRFRHWYSAYDVLTNRGSWEENEEKLDKHLHPTWFERFKCLFDSNRRGAFWYTFWVLMKAIMSSIILAAVFAPELNASFMVALTAADNIVLLVFHPNSEWTLFLHDLYRGCVNLASLTAVLCYFRGVITEAFFPTLLMFLSIISLIPSMIAALLGPVVGVLNAIYSTIFFLCSDSHSGVTMAVATVAVVAYEDNDMHTAAMQAADKDSKSEQSSDAKGHFVTCDSVFGGPPLTRIATSGFTLEPFYPRTFSGRFANENQRRAVGSWEHRDSATA